MLSLVSVIAWSYVPYLIFGFLSGTCMLGIQGPLLNNPFDFKNASPRRVGIFFSIIWGLGFMVFTVINIILAAIVDVSPTAYYVVLGLCMLGLPVSCWFTKEPFVGNKISFNPFAARIE